MVEFQELVTCFFYSTCANQVFIAGGLSEPERSEALHDLGWVYYHRERTAGANGNLDMEDYSDAKDVCPDCSGIILTQGFYAVDHDPYDV